MARTNAVLGVVLGLGVAAAAMGQPIPIHNPGFETPNPDDGSLPEGWGFFNTAVYRDDVAHTGTRSVELAEGADFVGITTNVFNPDTFELYDPPIVFRGGAVTVTGWYMIPADEPLVGTSAGFKLEFRRVPPNFSIYQQHEELNISGTTGGEWVQHRMTFNCAQFEDHDGTTESVSVLAIRFPEGSGTIFWDDLTLFQCRADFNCDDTLSPADFAAFRDAFLSGDDKADLDNNGDLTPGDFTAFRDAFLAGCP